MIPVMELKRQYESIKQEIDEAVASVLDSGWFVLGKNVAAFEEEFAAYCGTRFAVGVGSGVEALHLALLACGIGPGDEVITIPFTAVPTALGISLTGAAPVFVDVDADTCLMDPALLPARISEKTKAILPVHLYGQCADMDRICATAREHGIMVVEDAAQAHGACWKGKKAGALGDVGCFSFYPSKNLGAYGEAGMVTTNDEAIAERVRMLRNYGQGDRYHHKIKGVNSRLDELQAAILRVKLRHLDEWNERRRQIAAIYNSGLADTPLRLPVESDGAEHVYHLYAIRTEERDALRGYLTEKGVGTQIHYPIPVHLQEAYADLGLGEGAFPRAERAAREVLSLPMFPELRGEEVKTVIQRVRERV